MPENDWEKDKGVILLRLDTQEKRTIELQDTVVQGFKDLGDKFDAHTEKLEERVSGLDTRQEVTDATLKTKAKIFGALLTAVATVVGVLGLILTFIHFLKGG